jgi:hypothetical protein
MSLKDRLPRVLPVFDPARDISGFIDGFDDELDRLDADVADAEDSLQVENASGQALDLIGEDFGPFGERRGRTDAQYREFLTTFLSSFDGRGTTKDVRVGAAAGAGSLPQDVKIREDFENAKYRYELFDWAAHSTGEPRLTSELADPAAVDLFDTVYYVSDTGNIDFADNLTQTSARIGFDAQQASSSLISKGLSSVDFDTLETTNTALSEPIT